MESLRSAFPLILLVLLLSSSSSGSKLISPQKGESRDLSLGDKDLDKKPTPVSFTTKTTQAEKAKFFGQIPIPWPFNVTSIPEANQNPGGGLTGSGNNGNIGDNGFGGAIGTLGTSAILIKGGFLTMLTALKAVIIPPLILILLIAFLVAGAAFFTCSIVDCSTALGSLGGLGGGGGGIGGTGAGGISNPFSSFRNPFDRNTYDYYEQARPVYQALDDGYQKYGPPLGQSSGSSAAQ